MVGTLSNRTGGAIGLLADMDALDVDEYTGVKYASEVPGKKHAYGHDGHTAMLPDYATLRGTAREFAEDAQTSIEPSMRRIAENTAAAHGR